MGCVRWVSGWIRFFVTHPRKRNAAYSLRAVGGLGGLLRLLRAYARSISDIDIGKITHLTHLTHPGDTSEPTATTE
jgi:hypothetical protein